MIGILIVTRLVFLPKEVAILALFSMWEHKKSVTLGENSHTDYAEKSRFPVSTTVRKYSLCCQSHLIYSIFCVIAKAN